MKINAHSDIAFEFASRISPEFKLYIIKDYQRLKLDEAKRLEIGWDTKREQGYTYANEADLLNIALFGKTAKQWRKETGNPKSSNMRDFASVEQLIVLVNLESINADLIRQNISAPERLKSCEASRITNFILWKKAMPLKNQSRIYKDSLSRNKS